MRCDGWVSVPPELRWDLYLSFLCSRTIGVVFRGCTGIYTGLDGRGVGWSVSPLGWDGFDGCILPLHSTIVFSIDNNVNISSPCSKIVHTKFIKPLSF